MKVDETIFTYDLENVHGADAVDEGTKIHIMLDRDNGETLSFTLPVMAGFDLIYNVSRAIGHANDLAGISHRMAVFEIESYGVIKTKKHKGSVMVFKMQDGTEMGFRLDPQSVKNLALQLAQAEGILPQSKPSGNLQ